MLKRLQSVFASLRSRDVRYVVRTYHRQEFFVVSREDLIASKRAAGREKDLEDVRALELHLKK